MAKTFITKVSNLDKDVQEALEWIDVQNIVKSGTRVFIKPNLTYPYYKEGVTTSPIVVEALIKALQKLGARITIVESDGGYHSWKAEDAFKGHGLYALSEKYGVRLLNLCKSEKGIVRFRSKDKNVEIPFPKVLMDDADLFITMPVPKIHAMTGVSLALKNQWGCIPDTMRLLFHWCFDDAIVVVNRSIKRSIVVADGTYMLDRNGPMSGDPVKADLLVVSSDLGAFELTGCKLMGIDPDEISHLRIAKRNGVIRNSLDDIIFNQPIKTFCRQFKLVKTKQNRLGRIAFHSKFLTEIGYNSKIGDILHRILYKVKGKPVWHE